METNWGSWGSESRWWNYVNTPVKYVIVESGSVKYGAMTCNSGVRIDVATRFLTQLRLDRQNKCLAVDKPQIPQCDYDLVRVRHNYHSVRVREGSCFDLSWKLLWGLSLEVSRGFGLLQMLKHSLDLRSLASQSGCLALIPPPSPPGPDYNSQWWEMSVL